MHISGSRLGHTKKWKKRKKEKISHMPRKKEKKNF